MPFMLGGITLPNPTEFTRESVEVKRVNLLLNGTTKQKVIRKKERYILHFQYLTRAEADSVLSEYELNSIRSFSVPDEDNITLDATDVLIDVENREYVAKGVEYRENFDLILTEVL